MILRLLPLILGLLCTALPVGAEWIPSHLPAPGGVAVIDLGSADDSRPRQVTYQGRPVMIRASEGRWKALVGVALDAEPGSHQVLADGRPMDFRVWHRDYDEQRITLRNPRQVNPSEEDLARIGRESERIRTALAVWSDEEPAVLQMPLPATGRFSSPFGLRRYFNDQPRKPHSGLDIASETGTPVLAPAGARVTETGDFFFNGNTVILDHGHGLVTMYCHLDRIDVAPGDSMGAGQQLGTVGSTGRATGPHLHWGVYLNGNAVDPLLFVTP